MKKETTDQVKQFIEQILAADKKAIVVGHDLDLDLMFAYTTGLTLLGLPELICFGRTPEHIGTILHVLAEHVMEHGAFEDNWIDEGLKFSNLSLQIKTLKPFQARPFVDPAIEYLESRGKWPIYQQVVIPDRQNRLPHDKDFDHEYMIDVYHQPHLWEQQTSIPALGAQPHVQH